MSTDKDQSARIYARNRRQPLQPGWLAIIGVVVLVVGIFIGTNYTRILAAVAPIFGQTVVTDTLDLSSVQKTYQTILKEYDGEINKDDLIEGANRGLVDALGDEYTVYMSASEAEEFQKSLSGNIGGGVGIEVGIRNDMPTVIRVLRDNPAQEAGVMVGDVISAVNDQATAGKTLSDVVSTIRGDINTTVKLTMIRSGQLIDITIKRQDITSPSAYHSIEGSIGILTISRFDTDTANLARAAAREFIQAGVKGVIVDLRGNGGGYITAAQEVAGLWLKEKSVVIEKSQGKVIDELTTGRSAPLEGMPTVVVVNGSSASASEIVAGALQDYEVAVVLGETTFGKGSVQRLTDLLGGAELKVTIARWYTPKGRTISQNGIIPDKEVVLTADDVNSNRDPQLDAAKDLLR